MLGQLVAAPHGLVLIVEEAITIEPAETENLQMLNEFIEVMIAIDREGRSAQHTTVVKRADEVRPARQAWLAVETAELKRRGAAGEL